MGGKKHELEIDDYIFGILTIIKIAAIMLYLDILNLFLYILDLLNKLDKK
jgi:FtsH-binding integral membrane protein